MNKTILIDFDNVIHNAFEGYKDGEIYGQPVHGAIFTIQNLMREYRVVIFTSRQPSEWEKIRNWLREYDFPQLEITNIKIPAKAYIDNRAIRFTNWADMAFYLL